MSHVRILVRYGGAWDERRKYEGGVLKGIIVSKEITHKDLQDELYDLAEVDSIEFDIKIRCIYEIKVENKAPPFELSNGCDLKFYILSENPLEVPLYVSFEPRSNQSKKVLNKYYNSVSGSNKVHSLNPHPPIAMDTLDENEIDIDEVQVGLCDNMIETTSAIWESYNSYDSKDNTFTRKSVEMNNESFDIPQQRDAPTKDCKGKAKVHYISSSRKLKIKRSDWSEESSTIYSKKSLQKRFLLLDASTTSVVEDCERQAKSWVVRELIKSKFKGVGRLYKSRDIIEDIKQDYGINMSYEKAWSARENAYERVRGSPEESYNLLRRYGEALKLTNPGTIFHMELEDDRFFKYLFMAVGPCIRGFLNCIRLVIVMDGTFLKNKYWGQLTVSVCLDGNNQIYPLAFKVVDRETDDLIQWFLEKLKGAIGKMPNLGFVTDRKTCFSKAYVEAVYLVRNQSNWKTSEDYIHMTVLPPKVVKRVGRPKKKRIPSVDEAPKLHKCGQCKEIGHNRLTCTNPISYTEKLSIQD
ncbi:MuDRA-like transposase [Cucumis melo var. makuwa]|uniref:MuDRA-like transposase n=1 Tax=Cucumis melo var. makuwa TaxID=1194695 RepID=A0A5A7TCE7_CUCMM|nr:MuDRA-like transposase [Cucumis melo var. makuwa]